MTKNNIIITILAVLIVILAGALIARNHKGDDAMTASSTEMDASTTPAATKGTNTTTKTNTIIKTVPVTTTGGVVAPTEVFPKQFILSVANSFTLADGTVVTLNNLDDSRCPSDPNIRCVVAGNVVASLTIKKGTSLKAFTLTYPGNTNTNVIVINEYKISFDNVNPDRGLQSNPTAKKDYKLTFTVSK